MKVTLVSYREVKLLHLAADSGFLPALTALEMTSDKEQSHRDMPIMG